MVERSTQLAMTAQPTPPEESTARPARKPHVALVNTRAELKEFIDLPGNLEGWSEMGVPVMADEITKWYRDKGVVPGVRLWLARDPGGRPVGRMVTHRSAMLNGRLSRGPEALAPRVRAQLFGAFVAADEVCARELLETVTRMARGVGATHVFGPCTLLPNSGGVLRSGFERPGFFNGAWNPQWLPGVLEESGFSPWHIADTWRIDVAAIPEQRAARPTQAEWRAKGLRARHPSRIKTRKAAMDLLSVLNDSYGQLPYFTRFPRELWQEKLAGLEPILDPDLIVLADDASDGTTVSFSLVLPDPIRALRASNGRINYRSTARFLRAKLKNETRDAVLVALGTHPDAQMQGALNLVTREIYAALKKGGYDHLHVTRISRDNPGAAAVLSKAGGNPEHEIAFYVKELPADHWSGADEAVAAEGVLG